MSIQKIWTKPRFMFLNMSRLYIPSLSMSVTVSGLSCASVLVLFIVSTWLVVCFLCAMCSPVYCLAPPILLSDYWLICPTYLASLCL